MMHLVMALMSMHLNTVSNRQTEGWRSADTEEL
jgi:hypothetical protein